MGTHLDREKAKTFRQEQAQKRQDAYNKLTIEQKIDKLDFKFGKGVGAKKERARLQKRLEEQSGRRMETKVPTELEKSDGKTK